MCRYKQQYVSESKPLYVHTTHLHVFDMSIIPPALFVGTVPHGPR